MPGSVDKRRVIYVLSESLFVPLQRCVNSTPRSCSFGVAWAGWTQSLCLLVEGEAHHPQKKCRFRATLKNDLSRRDALPASHSRTAIFSSGAGSAQSTTLVGSECSRGAEMHARWQSTSPISCHLETSLFNNCAQMHAR